jgi:hypothetical protein
VDIVVDTMAHSLEDRHLSAHREFHKKVRRVEDFGVTGTLSFEEEGFEEESFGADLPGRLLLTAAANWLAEASQVAVLQADRMFLEHLVHPGLGEDHRQRYPVSSQQV